MIHLNQEFIDQHTNYMSLIEALKTAFAEQKVKVPQRHHHHFGQEDKSTLLVMPAWQNDKNLGVKIVTVNPENSKLRLPSIQGVYIYIDAKTGVVKATLDGKALTTKRTAAASALASSFLSKAASNSLLMIGTGALSTELIKAHATVRPIKEVFVWGRHFEKAKRVCAALRELDFEVYPIKTIEERIKEVDIISTATLATEPLILNDELGENQHIDLVGSFKPNMREVDDAVMKNSLIYVDTIEALYESGDLSQPLENGTIKESDIKNNLFGLCKINKNIRESKTGHTVFKSVGFALEDLVAANYYFDIYEKLNS